MSALARNTDPSTSHLAASCMNATGSALSNKICVAMRVSLFSGQLTAAEINKQLEYSNYFLGHVEVQRRLSDLKRDGLVRMTDSAVRCKVKGTMMRRWVALPGLDLWIKNALENLKNISPKESN